MTVGVSLDDVSYDCVELGIFSFENLVGRINAYNSTVCRNRHNLQIVRIHEFGGFCLCRTSHTRKLGVHAEVVLQGDCRQRLVFFFNLDAFFGFNCLVNTFAPATTFKNTTRKFVDDFYFATLNDVVLVAAIQLFGLQRHLQLMHKIALNFVVQVVET